MKTLKELLAKAKVNENGELDESIVSELEAFVSELVEAKVEDRASQLLKEAVDPVSEQVKNELSEQYEQAYEEYKAKITENFSNFVDSVLDEELNIPEEVLEWAEKGRRYSDLIDTIRTRIAVDEGAVDSEVKGLIRDAANEIKDLKRQLNQQISETLEAKNDAKTFAAHIYLRKKCDGLSEMAKSRVLALLQDETDVKKIDEKFSFIVDNVLDEGKETGHEHELGIGHQPTDIQNYLEHACVCPKCGKQITVADTNVCCSMIKCPECDDTFLVDAEHESVSRKKSKADEPIVSENFASKAAQLYAQLLD